MNQEKEVELWTQAFRNQVGADSVPQSESKYKNCPTDEAVWDAATGAANVKARRKIVEHTARCAACAESWRMARELGEAAQRNPHGSGKVIAFRPKSARAAWAGVLAAAAVLILSLGIGYFQPWQQQSSSGDAPIYRGVERIQITSHIEGEKLSRSGAQLSWTIEPQLEGVTYQVRVTGEDLFQVVYQAENLEQTSVTIPGEQLDDLPAGSHLLWQVTVTNPDGSTKSASFVNPLE